MDIHQWDKENIQQFDSGAVRDNTNTLPWSTMPWAAIRELAEVYQEGKIRYGAANWRKGLPYSNIIDHLMDHLSKAMIGDDLENTIEKHWAKVAWAALTLVEYYKTHPEQNDIWRYITEKENHNNE